MTDNTSRREFLKRTAALGAGLSTASLSQYALAAPIKTTQSEPDGFFTLGKQKSHWWLVTPDGIGFDLLTE